MPMPAAVDAIAGVLRLPLRPSPSSSLVVRCRSPSSVGEGNKELQIGSPVVVVVAPPTLKTAFPMPSLKVNTGQVKPGDVGRIISRNQKMYGLFALQSAPAIASISNHCILTPRTQANDAYKLGEVQLSTL